MTAADGGIGGAGPPPAQSDAGRPRALPRGPHTLPREFVVRSQRDRMLNAMAEVCAADGYARATVAAVIARAGVSRKTFYEHFRDREDCFLAAYDAILARFIGTVVGAYQRAGSSWPGRIRAAIEALLGFLAAEPAFARMCIVEVLTVGERAIERYLSAVRLLGGLLDEGRAVAASAEQLPEGTAVAVIHGSALVLREQILAGEVRRLPELTPDLVYAALVPYLGQREALDHAYGSADREA